MNPTSLMVSSRSPALLPPGRGISIAGGPRFPDGEVTANPEYNKHRVKSRLGHLLVQVIENPVNKSLLVCPIYWCSSVIIGL